MRSHARVSKALGVLLVAVLALAACGNDRDSGGETSSPAQDGGTGGTDGGSGGEGEGGDGVVRVAVVVDLSGPAAFAGLGDRAGIEAALADIEEQGFLDEEIELEFYDAETNPDRAIEHVNSIVNDDEVDVLIGPLNASHALATAPVAQQAGVPNVLMHADAVDIESVGDLIFRITPPQPTFIGASVENFASRGIETVGLLYDETNPTLVQIAEEVLPPLFDEHGMEVVFESTFRPTDTDFSASATQIADADPDGVAMLAVGAVNVTILRQLREQGYDGPLFAQNASGVFTDAGADADGIIWSTPFNPQSDLETPQHFAELFEAETGETPDHFNATGFDALWFVARAVEAGGDGRDGIAAGLATVAEEGFEGAQGELTFEGRDARVTPTVMQIQGGVEAPYEG